MPYPSTMLENLEHVDLAKAKLGLIYDPEGVSLIGKFADELSVHRARKEWKTILSNHFLLEPQRDYEIYPFCSLEDNSFVLICVFASACGRYAFWRLANRQAPEAEAKLGEACERERRFARGVVGSHWVPEDHQTSLLMSALEEQVRETDANTGLVERILKLFK